MTPVEIVPVSIDTDDVQGTIWFVVPKGQKPSKQDIMYLTEGAARQAAMSSIDTPTLIARCDNVSEPDGEPCMGRIYYQWGMTVAACDVCGGHCGIAVATWVEVFTPQKDARDGDGNYLGKSGTHAEHRTVGDYRAMCLNDSEWCYPHDACRCCKELVM